MFYQHAAQHARLVSAIQILHVTVQLLQCERGLFQRKWHFDDILKQIERLRCQIQDILQV